MSMVSEVLRNEETRADGMRTVAGSGNRVETLEGQRFLVRRPFPTRRSERDPLRDARKRVRVCRRADARTPTVGEPGEARQDEETALPGDPQTR